MSNFGRLDRQFCRPLIFFSSFLIVLALIPLTRVSLSRRVGDARVRFRREFRAMSLTSVKMAEEVWLTCLTHALTTETEEIMGLLLGDIQVIHHRSKKKSHLESILLFLRKSLDFKLSFWSCD